MTGSGAPYTDDEIEEFTSRVKRLGDPDWTSAAEASPEQIGHLISEARRGIEVTATGLAQASLMVSEGFSAMMKIVRLQEKLAFLVGDTDALPGEAQPPLSDAVLPTNPGAVVRAGLGDVYVRDARGMWSCENGTIAIGDTAMRAHAAFRLEVLSPGVALSA